MKKALHENQPIFLETLPGKFSRWDANSVDVLLDLANDVKHEYETINAEGWATLKRGSILTFGSREESISVVLRVFLNKFLNDGADVQFFEDLNHILKDIPFRNVIIKSKKKNPEWAFIANMTTPMTPLQNATILFSHLVTTEALDKVKLCNMSKCNNFFVGSPNKKWCSKKCGSLHRVRKKRKRDIS